MAERLTKKVYEQELERLQLELIDLQDVVREKGLRVAVLMEGRDAAGKGGIIKRITEHLNPRACRVVALGVPTERERGQWYFQRYVERLPAAGEICLFDRSWYNRAGVERVMGFCDGGRRAGVLPRDARPRADAGGLRAHPAQVLARGERRGPGGALPRAGRGSHQAVEAQPHRPRGAQEVRRLLAGPRRHVRPHGHPRVAVVRRGRRRPAARPPQLHRPPARLDPARASEAHARPRSRS